jgi:hypothetical protein
MNTRIAIFISILFLAVGVVAASGCGTSGGVPTLKASVGGVGAPPSAWGGGGSPLQEGGGVIPPGVTPGAAPTGGMSDVMVRPGAGQAIDKNLQDALDGVKDYEVTYDTTRSHAENTPPELRALGVTYAGEESPVAQRTAALDRLDLLDTLAGRYDVVEDQYAADPEKDFAPDEPDRTLNYYQPRGDPFIVPDDIPEELRPEMEGTGLEGAVDPELLEELFWATYEANLRHVPIIVVGVMQAGPYRGVIYTIAGWGGTRYLELGDQDCITGWIAPFSITPSQISEDFVVLTLRGHYDRGCRYAATGPVVRTFHVPR